ncbi:MAG: hypothetical protein HWE14_03670 [Flavobacteriia bacterium]|nr:hypothetical protein [Flavobacteriia bacterium]
MDLPEWAFQALGLGVSATIAFTLNAISKRQDEKLFEQRTQTPGIEVYKVKPITRYLGFFFLALGLLGSYFLSSPGYTWIYLVMFFGITLLGLWLIGLSIVAKVTITNHEVTSYGIFENRKMQLTGLIKEKKRFYSETIELENDRGEKVMISDSIANREHLVGIIHSRSYLNSSKGQLKRSVDHHKIAKRSH